MFKDPLTLPHLTGITGKFTLYPSPNFQKLVKHVLHERPISPINILFSLYVLLQDLTPSPVKGVARFPVVSIVQAN